MSNDTLTIICHTIEDGKKASRNITKFNSIDRFFIFLESPQGKEHPRTWMEYGEQYIFLPPDPSLPENPVNYAVRAGLMYSVGFCLLFCFANNVPTTEEICQAGEEINEKSGVYQGNKVWGCNRSNIVTEGFDIIYPRVIKKKIKEVNIEELSKAMAGLVVEPHVAIDGIKEVVQLRSICADIKTISKELEPFAAEINALSKYYDTTNPSTIILGDLATEDDLYKHLNIPDNLHTIIVLITNAEWTKTSDIQPYQVFNVDSPETGIFQVLCYRPTVIRI